MQAENKPLFPNAVWGSWLWLPSLETQTTPQPGGRHEDHWRQHPHFTIKPSGFPKSIQIIPKISLSQSVFHTRLPDISWRQGRNGQMFCGKSCIHTVHQVLSPSETLIKVAVFWGERGCWPGMGPFSDVRSAVFVRCHKHIFRHLHFHKWPQNILGGRKKWGWVLFWNQRNIYSVFIPAELHIDADLRSAGLGAVGCNRLRGSLAADLSFLCSAFQVTPSLSPWTPGAPIKSVLAFVPLGTNITGVNIPKQNKIVTLIILTEWVHRACSE